MFSPRKLAPRRSWHACAIALATVACTSRGSGPTGQSSMGSSGAPGTAGSATGSGGSATGADGSASGVAGSGITPGGAGANGGASMSRVGGSAGTVDGGSGGDGTPRADGSSDGSGEAGGVGGMDAGYPDAKPLAAMILNDPDIAATKTLCDNILANGFSAGSGYPQVWIPTQIPSSRCFSTSSQPSP